VAIEREGLPSPRWRKLDGNAVAVVVVVLAFLLAPGCGSGRGDDSIDPILYVLGAWLAAIVIVAFCAERIVRRVTPVETRDDVELES